MPDAQRLALREVRVARGSIGRMGTMFAARFAACEGFGFFLPDCPNSCIGGEKYSRVSVSDFFQLGLMSQSFIWVEPIQFCLILIPTTDQAAACLLYPSPVRLGLASVENTRLADLSKHIFDQAWIGFSKCMVTSILVYISHPPHPAFDTCYFSPAFCLGSRFADRDVMLLSG